MAETLLYGVQAHTLTGLRLSMLQPICMELLLRTVCRT